MPELPEITVIAAQMSKEIVGKRVAEIEAKQPKNLNMPIPEFVQAAKGKIVSSVSSKGKWILMKLDPGYFMLINLGMGGDLIYLDPDREPPEGYQFRLAFDDDSGFTIRFNWFGNVHLVAERDLAKHKQTARLGTSPLDKEFTLEYFNRLLAGRRGRVKGFLLNQKNIAGIGNVYIQDILFEAKLHPNRDISTLSTEETGVLYSSIRKVLDQSIHLGGLAYEKDFYGRNGRFGAGEFKVGYKEGKPCPTCGTMVQKIKTGSTSTYICPKCQPLKK